MALKSEKKRNDPDSPPHKPVDNSVPKLLEVMETLRDPDCGCPWDIRQSFETIAPYTIEESYEVADAIANKDWESLKDELGDLLLQVVYHAQMAREQDFFTFADVVTHVTEKMISRHPHVFGDKKAATEGDVNILWEQRKEEERTRKSKEKNKSILDGVALALPALMRAHKLQKRAARKGFEWTNARDVLLKLDEEIGELKEAIQDHDPDSIGEEFGDILFVIVNLARLHNVDSEGALRATNQKFERRFRGLEAQLKSERLDIQDIPLEDLILRWNEEKKKEKSAQANKS